MGMHIYIPVCQTIYNRLSMIAEGATVYLKGLLHGLTADLTTGSNSRQSVYMTPLSV